MTILYDINKFFYSWPFNEPKPPSSAHGILTEDGSSWSGVEIQFAVAGFKRDDIKVSVSGRNLYVEGDNQKREDINSKFRCSFARVIPVKESLDIDSIDVKLEDGILSISIPKKTLSSDSVKVIF